MVVAPSLPSQQITTESVQDTSLTEEEIIHVALAIQSEGRAATRRLVRERLGRGSMTTINRTLQKLEAEQRVALPEFLLGPTDQDMILSTGAQLFAALHKKIQDISTAREKALLDRCSNAEAAAAEAVETMEMMLSLSSIAERSATEAQKAADARANQAVEDAVRAAERMLHLQGQLEVLTADREAFLARLGRSEEQVSRLGERLTQALSEVAAAKLALTSSERQCQQLKSAGETAASNHARELLLMEGRMNVMEHAANQAHAESAEQKKLNVIVQKSKSELDARLAAAQAELAATRRIVQHLENEVSRLEVNLVQARNSASEETKLALAAQGDAAKLMQDLLDKALLISPPPPDD
jgi:hypothetical protein